MTEETIKEMRKELRITKLRDKIPISDFEKVVVLNLRKNELHRLKATWKH